MFIFRVFLILLFFYSFSLFGEEFNFKKVKFYGLNYFSKEEVLNKIVDDTDIYKCSDSIFLKKISELNIFNKIEVFWNDNEIKVFCVEKPIINKVILHVDSDKEYILSLLDRFEMCRGCLYDINNVNFLKNALIQFYSFSGFNNPNIDVDVILDKKINSIDLIIKIDKCFLQKIKNIDIIGISIFDKAKLTSLLSYSKSNWMSFFLKDDLFFSDWVENDVDGLKSYYFDRGYSDFHINFIRVFFSKKNNSVKVLLNVSEGECYYIDSINVHGDKVILQTDKLQNEFKNIMFSYLKIGSIFSREMLFEVKSKLKDFLMRNGFFNSDIDFSIFYAGESRVGINFSIIKSEKTRVGYISFFGNFLTCDNVLRRMISFTEGSVLSLDDVEFSKNEIMRSGIADNVNVEYARNPDDHSETDVYYMIDEQKFGRVTAGLSYSNDDGFSINLNTELSNFLGLGSDIALDVTSNGVETDFMFNYLIPYFSNENFGIGYNLYYRSDLFDQDADYINTLYETFGAYLYYSWDLNKFEKFNFGVGCDMTFLGMYDELSSIEIKKFIELNGFDFRDYFFNLVWNYNSFDKFSYALSGVYHNIIFRFNMPGSKIKCFTFNYDFNYYNNFYDDYILNITSSLYYGNVYASDDDFPFFKNFHMRGNTNIRGFKERMLGPKDSNDESIGGNFLLCAKFSLYVPTFLPDELKDIRTSLFFDIGNVYDTSIYTNEALKSKLFNYFSSLKISLGISFVWSTPFGMPLEIALAYPFNSDDEESKNIISISFG
ncbi:MAG TPA: outer membrane protein assembly factor BamA [Candidatus Azoamicus sp.]